MDVIIEVIVEVIYAIAMSEGIKKGVNKEYIERNLRKGLPQDKQEAFLLFIILMYLFYDNDGRYTPKEKRLINSELNSKRGKITNSDYMMYKSILSKKQTIDDIKDLIIKQDYNQITIGRVFKEIRSLLIMDKTYYLGIKELESTLYELV